MLSKRLIATAVVGALVTVPNCASATRCLKYDPAPVTLTGTMFERWDFGPPNYGEDPATDSKELYFYVRLDRATCVDATLNADDNDGTSERHITLMQIVYFVRESFNKAWLGRHVAVSGTLFHAISGHHHTRVLITPTETRVLEFGAKAKHTK